MPQNKFRVAVLTASDQGAAGTREDKSGPLICQMMKDAGYEVAGTALLPDEEDVLSGQLRRWCEDGGVDLILTTGGTGFSSRDCMPEATLAVAQRLAPGVAEAIRANSMQITPRAMLSRGVSVLCGQTLIINLPGSPKAVRESLEFVLPSLAHGLEVLRGQVSECAR